jgi:uncharacterized membrane protein HdeD (DUF308 family)
MTHIANPSLAPRLMLHALWLLLLRGIVAILFGVLTFAWPGITLLTLVLFYGAFALVDGVLAITAAVMGGAPAPRWWLAIVGLLGIAVGILTFAWPGVTALILLLFIAGWAIATGALQIVGAIALRKEIDNEWLLIASGVLSVLFGLILVIPTPAERFRRYTVGGNTTFRKRPSEGKQSAGVGMTQPQTGSLALLFVIGAYAILYGILLVFFSLRLRGHSYATNV